jgi:hypothetical protein
MVGGRFGCLTLTLMAVGIQKLHPFQHVADKPAAVEFAAGGKGKTVV